MRNEVANVSGAMIIENGNTDTLLWRPPSCFKSSCHALVSWCPAAPGEDGKCVNGLHSELLTSEKFTFPYQVAAAFLSIVNTSNNITRGLQRVHCRVHMGQYETDLLVVTKRTTEVEVKLVGNLCAERTDMEDLLGLLLDTWSLTVCPLGKWAPCRNISNINSTTTTISQLEPGSCYNITHSTNLGWNISSHPTQKFEFCTGNHTMDLSSISNPWFFRK